MQKFKELFKRESNFNGIDIGTTEAFQGQERKVIILSTVRSSSRYLQNDQQFRLGFVSNPKRMNVAISRARSLLIIVGNARLLYSNDPYWKKFLEHCFNNNLFEGPFWEDTHENLDEAATQDDTGAENFEVVWKNDV